MRFCLSHCNTVQSSPQYLEAAAYCSKKSIKSACFRNKFKPVINRKFIKNTRYYISNPQLHLQALSMPKVSGISCTFPQPYRPCASHVMLSRFTCGRQFCNFQFQETLAKRYSESKSRDKMWTDSYDRSLSIVRIQINRFR